MQSGGGAHLLEIFPALPCGASQNEPIGRGLHGKYGISRTENQGLGEINVNRLFPIVKKHFIPATSDRRLASATEIAQGPPQEFVGDELEGQDYYSPWSDHDDNFFFKAVYTPCLDLSPYSQY
jgi:hypothetical protein